MGGGERDWAGFNILCDLAQWTGDAKRLPAQEADAFVGLSATPAVGELLPH